MEQSLTEHITFYQTTLSATNQLYLEYFQKKLKNYNLNLKPQGEHKY